MKPEITTYEQVAASNGLTHAQTQRYIRYMRTRWAEEEAQQAADGYAAEWAQRFRAGEEYIHSDREGRRILAEEDTR